MTLLEQLRWNKERRSFLKSPCRKIPQVLGGSKGTSATQVRFNETMHSTPQIDQWTEQAIRIEVTSLIDDDTPCTVQRIAQVVRSSPLVVAQYLKSVEKASDHPLSYSQRNTRKRRQTDLAMQHRYHWMNALNKLDVTVASSLEKPISSWEDARVPLSSVMTFPEEDPPSSNDNDQEVDNVTKWFERAELIPERDRHENRRRSQVQLRSEQEAAERETVLSFEELQAQEARQREAAERERVLRQEELEAQEERQREADARAATLLAAIMRPLTDAERQRVDEAMEGEGPETEVIARVDSDTCQRGSLRSLLPGVWLRDEVIHHFYIMLSKRDEEICSQDASGRKRSHFFKSFFFTKLLNVGHVTLNGVYEYRNVKRWSKKVPGTYNTGVDSKL
jgi:Ulp1 family protease